MRYEHCEYFVPKTHLYHTKSDYGMCLCEKNNISNQNIAIEWYPEEIVVVIKLYLINSHTLLYLKIQSQAGSCVTFHWV